jgi:hypothetical protein
VPDSVLEHPGDVPADVPPAVVVDQQGSHVLVPRELRHVADVAASVERLGDGGMPQTVGPTGPVEPLEPGDPGDDQADRLAGQSAGRVLVPVEMAGVGSPPARSQRLIMGVMSGRSLFAPTDLLACYPQRVYQVYAKANLGEWVSYPERINIINNMKL